ncbi:MAG: queuosine salvage family protein [Ktedonobacteraceae bacterium]|nr:queuosine salvage family protein [Ktedonobacteraceae bacterium]
MRETFASSDYCDDDYPLPQSDPLHVLSSTLWVVEQGEYVWINTEQVEKLCEQWVQDEVGAAADAFAWDDRYHFYDGTERTVNWLLLLDALNFCFWSEKDTPRWSIEYQGEVLNGYWAEAAALKRAVEEGIPLWDAQYLSTISPETIAHVFRGTQTIPLFEQRVAHTREVGRVLLERYDGQFAQAVEKVRGSAVQLALLLADDFPSFRDRACYRNCEVHFLKRAQICVADLHGSFQGKQWGAFTDLAQLTAFADYKLPQVLRYYGVLAYDPTLAERIDRQEPLQPGSEEEIEIRAATVWACELLRRALLQRGRVMNAIQIDQKLWLWGQNSTAMRPYHRTRTIYY